MRACKEVTNKSTLIICCFASLFIKAKKLNKLRFEPSRQFQSSISNTLSLPIELTMSWCQVDLYNYYHPISRPTGFHVRMRWFPLRLRMRRFTSGAQSGLAVVRKNKTCAGHAVYSDALWDMAVDTSGHYEQMAVYGNLTRRQLKVP